MRTRINKYLRYVFVFGCLLTFGHGMHAREHLDWMPGDTWDLAGTSGATMVAVAEGIVLWDGGFYCDGWLTFTEKNAFVLALTEYMPDPNGGWIPFRSFELSCSISN